MKANKHGDIIHTASLSGRAYKSVHLDGSEEWIPYESFYFMVGQPGSGNRRNSIIFAPNELKHPNHYLSLERQHNKDWLNETFASEEEIKRLESYMILRKSYLKASSLLSEKDTWQKYHEYSIEIGEIEAVLSWTEEEFKEFTKKERELTRNTNFGI